VGLNLLFAVPGETGGREVYARHLVPALAAERPDIEFVAFVGRETAAELGGRPLAEGVETVVVDVPARSRIRAVLAEQFALPRLVRRHRIDLLHSLGTTAPRIPGTASVVTVHDLIYATHPEAHTPAMRLGMRALVPLGVRGADRIVADSQATADEVEARLGVPADRIDVVHLAGRPIGPATPEAELRARLDLGDAPIVLSVLAMRPHKNLARLLEAFASLDAEPAPVLVLPGYATGFEEDLRRLIASSGAAGRVRLPGWVSDPDLEGLYSAASCFVFPSLAEGFGLPVLEAMERGAPVASSNAGPMPEVAGDAARLFDPSEIAEIAGAMQELIADPVLAAEFAKRGRERAASFSWERAARETLAAYDRASTGVSSRAVPPAPAPAAARGRPRP
jgi:glycosyltransferase involved in cell wall biosynthesis